MAGSAAGYSSGNFDDLMLSVCTAVKRLFDAGILNKEEYTRRRDDTIDKYLSLQLNAAAGSTAGSAPTPASRENAALTEGLPLQVCTRTKGPMPISNPDPCKWYPGAIVRAHTADSVVKYDIKYDDGEEEESVSTLFTLE